MQHPNSRILIVDDNPKRLMSAATTLVVHGYSVLPVSASELRFMLASDSRDWKIDLVLLRAELDPEIEELMAKTFGHTPVRKISRTIVFDLNLPDLVKGLATSGFTHA